MKKLNVDEKTLRLWQQGQRLILLRTTMKKKQKEIAEALGVDCGNYCHMEKGRLDAKDKLEKVEQMFIEWREREINRLQRQIKNLKDI